MSAVDSVVNLVNTITFLEARRQRRRRKKRIRNIRLAKVITEKYGMRVQEGPFAGMKYPSAEAAGSALLPKLFGTYEEELHEFVDRALNSQHRRIINVGCGEGYYAVGMALQMPQAHVYAFDADENARGWCYELAEANDVGERVTIGGFCDWTRLGELTEEPAFILCDCEGGELDLLRPDLVPGLIHCDLLVELHKMPRGGNTRSEIVRRFAPTHHVELRKYSERDPSAYPAIDVLEPGDRHYAVDEFRSRGLEWVSLERRK